MRKGIVIVCILFPLVLGAQTLDTLAAKKTLDSLVRVAASYHIKRDYVAMQASAVQMIALQERLYGHQSAEVAFGLNNLTMATMKLGDLDLAIRSAEEALAIRSSLFDRNHPIVAMSLNTLGLLYSRVGRSSEAEACFLEFKSSAIERLGPHHPDVGYALMHLAGFYYEIGRYRDAEACILELKDNWGEAYGQHSAYYAMTLGNLAAFVQSLGRFKEAEHYLLEAKSIQENAPNPDQVNYAHTLNKLGALFSATGRYQEAITILEQAIQTWENSREKDWAAYAGMINNLGNAYAGIGNSVKAEELIIKSLENSDKVPAIDFAKRLNNFAILCQNTNRGIQADSLYTLTELIMNRNVGRRTQGYVWVLINHATLYQSLGRYSDCDRLLTEALDLDYDMLRQATQFLSEEELSGYIEQFGKRSDRILSLAAHRQNLSGPLSELCFTSALNSKGFIEETVTAIRSEVNADSTIARKYKALIDFHRRLAQIYNLQLDMRDSAFLRYAEPRANTLEKEISRAVSGYTEAYRIIRPQDVRNSLAPGEAAVEWIAFTNYDLRGNPTDSTMYAALVLLPTDTTLHFIPLFEKRQLQTLFKRPGFDEQLTVKGLYGAQSKLLALLWNPLEPLLRRVKTIYYSPAGLLHRINPAALLDTDKQPLSAVRQWVRLGSTRELVARRLADRSFALTDDPQTSSTATIWGGIRYDMDSLAFAVANPLDNADATTELAPKDGMFRFMVEDGIPELLNCTRGAGGDGWKPLAGSAREAKQVGTLLQKAGFRTEVLSEYAASEERFKALGRVSPSPRILHVATHGFAYPDLKKEPAKTISGAEPTYKLQDDPMLRSGLILAGANYCWQNKHPLENREDGVLVAYEVRDLNLHNTELAVLSACQTGLGDVVGSEGVYGLQRAFRIAGAKFLIVSLWQVPDEQTQELMRLFYVNWVDKRQSLRDAFNHAQATLREREPNPYMWAGFVLVE